MDIKDTPQINQNTIYELDNKKKTDEQREFIELNAVDAFDSTGGVLETTDSIKTDESDDSINEVYDTEALEENTDVQREFIELNAVDSSDSTGGVLETTDSINEVYDTEALEENTDVQREFIELNAVDASDSTGGVLETTDSIKTDESDDSINEVYDTEALEENTDVPEIPGAGWRWSDQELQKAAEKIIGNLRDRLDAEALITSMLFFLMAAATDIEVSSMMQASKMMKHIYDMVQPMAEATKFIEEKQIDAERTEANARILGGSIEVFGGAAGLAGSTASAFKGKRGDSKGVDIKVKKQNAAAGNKPGKPGSNTPAGGAAPSTSGQPSQSAQLGQAAQTPPSTQNAAGGAVASPGVKPSGQKGQKKMKKDKTADTIESPPNSKLTATKKWLVNNGDVFGAGINTLCRGVSEIIKAKGSLSAANIREEAIIYKIAKDGMQVLNEGFQNYMNKFSQQANKASESRSMLLNTLTGFQQSGTQSAKNMFGG